MNPVASLEELKRLLPECLLQDHLRIGASFARWRQEHPRVPVPAAELERWLAAARASVELRRRRQASLPPIDYPPQLPITARRTEIVAALREHQVLVIAGETGSGKTTQIPKMCLEAGLGLRARIGCTQPRRLAALSVSRRLAEELDREWGREVGCKIRFSDQTRPETCVKFMTDGMLLAEVQGDPLLSEYEAIILDEAHERSLNIDFLLGCLKQLLARRPDLKLVITSATIDTHSFSRAFGDAPVIEVSGRLFPVEVVYAPIDEAAAAAGDCSYVDAAVNAVENILLESTAGDVLVFMPSERDILETRDAIEAREFGGLVCLPLFGRLSPGEQQRIFAPAARRKIVIATNIAETSLTVPGIRYVVDSGLARVSRYSPRTRTKRLPIEPISQSSANQRKGRCGRVADGVCIRLYAESDFAARPPHTQPEIQRANLAEVILRLKAARLGEIETFPFLNPPAPAAIQGGYQLLHELGALDERRELTELGRALARLPVDPSIGRMILQAQREGALAEVLVIAAGLSIQDPRERPLEQQDAASAAHRRFHHPRSDFLTLLNIWNAFHDPLESQRTQNQARKFCKAHFLSYPRMREWRDIHAQIRETLAELDELPANRAPADYAPIHRSILTGLWSHVVLRKERNLYQAGGNREVMLFPGSGLFERTVERRRGPKPAPGAEKAPVRTAQPPWAVAGEIIETSRLFARTVAEIDPEWILELAPHLYRRVFLNPHWSAAAGAVLAQEKVTLHGLLVRDRLTPYGPVNAAEATAIFLRAALVEEGLADHFRRRPRTESPALPGRSGRPGAHPAKSEARNPKSEIAQGFLDAAEAGETEARDLSTLPALYRFLEHNQQLRHKIELWQTRLPHRLVADLDEALLAAYTRRIASVASVPELNRLLRDRLGAESQFLRFTAADLLGEHAVAFNAGGFPDSVTVGSQPVPLRYAYAPGEDRDGVTVQLPFNLAQVIDPNALDWAVPALREPQILHLLQALPKTLRRALMPLPPKAAELAQAVTPAGNAFLPALIAFVQRRYGVTIPLAEWNVARLPPHLRPRFEIVGADRRPVAQGRDLAALRQQLERHDTTTETAAWQRAVQQWERYGVREWNFGDLPERVLVADVAGFPLHAFPALHVEGSDLAVRLFRAAAEAAASHRHAVPRLLELGVQRELAWLEKDLRGLARWRDLHASLGPVEQLEAPAFDHLKRHLFGPRPDWPREATAFAELLGRTRGQLPGLAAALIERTGEILQARQAVLVCRKPYPQMREDLAALLPPQFLRHIPFARLPHVPRYLKALLIRAERAAVSPAKDQEKQRRIQPFVEAYRKQVTACQSPAAAEKLAQCRWLLEEFKVSVFAQELGTAEPVSPQRLEAALAEAKAVAG